MCVVGVVDRRVFRPRSVGRECVLCTLECTYACDRVFFLFILLVVRTLHSSSERVSSAVNILKIVNTTRVDERETRVSALRCWAVFVWMVLVMSMRECVASSHRGPLTRMHACDASMHYRQ